MLLVALIPHPARARALISQQDALALAFGADATVAREPLFLTDDEVAGARELAGTGVEIRSALVVRYVGSRSGAVAGFAYFDTHVVRTLPETVMVVISPEGAVARVEVVAFAEPEDYLPRPRWYEQFTGKSLDRELAVGRGTHAITGATLTSLATTDAVRRVLAIHRIVSARSGGAR